MKVLFSHRGDRDIKLKCYQYVKKLVTNQWIITIIGGAVAAVIAGIILYQIFKEPSMKEEIQEQQVKATNGQEKEDIPIYDVAISFAGEDRELAEELASGLVIKGINVFYDKYEEANLWGKDLYDHLIKVYRDDSKYCLMLISEHYAAKQWTSHERKAAQSRAFSENQEYILPLRIDDTAVDGVLDTVGFIDARSRTTEELVELIVEKIQAYNKAHKITYAIVKVEDVFKKENIKPKNGRDIKDSDMLTWCPTCKTKQLLSEATISLDNDDTVYTCKNNCQKIVVVSRPGLVGWPGRGYRIGDYVIRNAMDILITIASGKPKVLIPASKAALMKRVQKNSAKLK